MTTHSPVALREFSGDQLFLVRKADGGDHLVGVVGTSDEMQATIRKYPEAFLAPSVLVCEGASEIGLLRGMSRYLTDSGKRGVEAFGVALVDGGGGSPAELIKRATIFQTLGFRSAVFIDSDVSVETAIEDTFQKAGGAVIRWRDGLALEDALFSSLPTTAVSAMLDRAVELHGEDAINANIVTKSSGKIRLSDVRSEGSRGSYSTATRQLLGQASRVDGRKARKGGWFKSVGYMEEIAFDIVAPCLEHWDAEFRGTVKTLWKWIASGR